MEPRRQPAQQRARGFTLLVSNVARLAGVVVTINETLLRPDLRPIALAVAALMIAGAQGLESFVEKLLGKP